MDKREFEQFLGHVRDPRRAWTAQHPPGEEARRARRNLQGGGFDIAELAGQMVAIVFLAMFAAVVLGVAGGIFWRVLNVTAGL